jgi:hypothetical protein
MKRLLSFGVVGLSLLVSACAQPTFWAARQAARDPQNEWKYNERQAAIAGDYVLLLKAARFNKEKGVWELDPKVVGVKDQLAVLRDRAKALDELLSYKDREFSRFVDWFKGLRAGFEKEEKITLWLLQRLQYIDTYNQFVDLVGELPKEMLGEEAQYFFPHDRETYSLRMIYPRRDIAKIPFTAYYLEAAKAQGILVKVDSFTVLDNQKYGKKIKDLRDENEFSWEEYNRGWQIDSYKILPDKEKPSDNIVQYIEIYRLDRAGVRESKPAAKGFLANGGSNVSVFLLDYDKEGENGFGSPDTMERIFLTLTTGRELYTDSTTRQSILEALYDRPVNDRKNPERRKPPEVPLYTAIVPMEQKIDIDVWEKGTFTVPLDYKNLAQNSEVIFEKPKTQEEKDLEKAKPPRKQIKVLIREFREGGEAVVIEYWIPKPEYSKRNVIDAVGLTYIFKIMRLGEAIEEADVSKFGKYIKMIDYRYGGRWFRIMDEDGDGVFEKRRIISTPVKGDINKTENNESQIY